MAITQAAAEAWMKRVGGTTESHATTAGWEATATLGANSATGSAPDEPEARYVAVSGLRKKIGRIDPKLLW
jgi:hypothetical protein